MGAIHDNQRHRHPQPSNCQIFLGFLGFLHFRVFDLAQAQVENAEAEETEETEESLDIDNTGERQ